MISLANYINNFWIINCLKLRRFLHIKVSDESIIEAYFNRYPDQYIESFLRVKTKPKESAAPLMNCALKWEGLGTGSPKAVCWHCNREMPRPHERRQCLIPAPDIDTVIKREVISFDKLITRAENILYGESPKTLTGKRLAYLHQTHGIDSSIAEAIVGQLSEAVHKEYMAEYEKHCMTGAAGQKIIKLV